MNTRFLQRRRALQARIAEERLSGVLSMNPASWYYLTGFTGEAGALLVSSKGSWLVTDGRFTSQAKEETAGLRVVRQEESLMATMGRLLRGRSRSRIGFDATQLSVAQFRALRKAAGVRVRWVRADGEVEKGRQRKDPAEMAQMRKAALLSDEVLSNALKLLKPGVREIEIAAEIEHLMRRRGASGPAFASIVAFGARSAPPRAYGDGIARSRKRKRPPSRLHGSASVAGMSMPPPEGFWRVTGLTIISCTAPDTDSGWKCTKTRGWRADRSTSWS